MLLRARLAAYRRQYDENFARMFPEYEAEPRAAYEIKLEVRRAEPARWKFLKRAHCRVHFRATMQLRLYASSSGKGRERASCSNLIFPNISLPLNRIHLCYVRCTFWLRFL